MKTRYGYIPDNELKLPIILKYPSLPIDNFLNKLYISEIDNNSSNITICKISSFLEKLKKNNNLSNSKISKKLDKSVTSVGDWFRESSNPSIIDMLLLCDKKSINKLYDISSMFTCPGSPHKITLPKKLDPSLAYLIGLCIGDAGLKDVKRSKKITNRYEHKIIIGDEYIIFTKFIQQLFELVFSIKTKIRKERLKKGEQFTYINPTSKVIHRYFTEVCDIPSGRGVGRIRVPKIIKHSNKELRLWFLRGLMDAEGDTRTIESGRLSSPRVKLRMAEEQFIQEVKTLLKEQGLNFTGPYTDDNKSWYIQTSKISKCRDRNLFMHPIKQWRLETECKIRGT